MKYLVFSLLGLTVVVILATVGLWYFGYQVAAAILGSFTVFSFLALFGVSCIAGAAWFVRNTYQAGAEIALRAQNFNDQWDAKKTAAFAALAKTMWNMSRPPSQQEPLRPLLEEAESFLPDLDEVVEGEMVGYEDRSDGA